MVMEIKEKLSIFQKLKLKTLMASRLKRLEKESLEYKMEMLAIMNNVRRMQEK